MRCGILKDLGFTMTQPTSSDSGKENHKQEQVKVPIPKHVVRMGDLEVFRNRRLLKNVSALICSGLC